MSTPSSNLTNEAVVKQSQTSIIKPMGDYPLAIERGQGVLFYDADGNEYLDAVSGEWVLNLGYRHPRVVEAIKQQLDKIEYVTPVYDNDLRAQLAARLVGHASERMSKVLFALSGADAVEGAMHLAIRATGGSEFVCLYGAFHGTTFATLALSYTYPHMLEGAKEGLDRYLTRQIRVPNYNCYRCPLGKTYPSCDLACANMIDQAIQHQSDAKVAGVIIELFQANGGMIPAPDGYVERVREICTRHGAAMIVDEVQTALCRCGGMFASSVFEADPDIIVMGKALGAGFPLSAVVAAEGFTNLRGWEAGFTLMSTPAICAGSLAMLDVMEEENLEQNARDLGEHMTGRLNALKDRFSIIGDVRSTGLMIGVELVMDRATKEPADDLAGMLVDHALTKERMLLGKSGPVFGNYGNVIKFKPAVNLTRDQADEILRRFERCLEVVQSELDRNAT